MGGDGAERWACEGMMCGIMDGQYGVWEWTCMMRDGGHDRDGDGDAEEREGL